MSHEFPHGLGLHLHVHSFLFSACSTATVGWEALGVSSGETCNRLAAGDDVFRVYQFQGQGSVLREPGF